MFYFNMYLIIIFTFFNNIIGVVKRRRVNNDIKRKRVVNDIILKLKNRNINKIKNIQKNNAPLLINDTNDKSFDKNCSEIIGCISIPKITHGHIFGYFYFFLNDILENNSMANELILNELKDDIDLFLVLLMNFIDNKKNIDIQAIKNYILENNKQLENLYFFENKGSFFDNNNYIIQTTSDLLLKIYNFLESEKIKDIIQKVKVNNELDDKESSIFAYYKFQESLINKNIWRTNNDLNNNDLVMTKISNNIIKKDIDDYLYSIKEEIEKKNDNIFQKIITTYLYSLLLKADIISYKLFESTISNTIFDKNDIYESLDKIQEAFKISEDVLTNLWTIISKNKELFKNSDQYKYIETIDKIGGISQYFKKYIMGKKSKNSSFMEKIKTNGSTILKVVGTGLLIATGIYAADNILGGNFIKKATDGLTNFVKTTKDNIFNWFKKTDSIKLLYKTSTTNFIEKGLLNTAGGVNDIIINNTKKILPAWCSSGCGAFISGMGLLALQEETGGLITNYMLQPIAQKLGFHGIDTNFSFYKYTRNKIVNFFTSIKTYYTYIISGSIINESAMIEKRFEYQKIIKKIIISANQNKNKYFKKFETLFFMELKNEIKSIDDQRYYKELKDAHYVEFRSKPSEL